MSTSTLGLFLRHLALNEEVSRLGTTSDHNLLAAYEAEQGQAAFTELMRRHGPMVLRTCRRLLSQESDAEDAFQATFVLLAQKAGSISKREALGGWLHRVAYRTALQVLRRAVRRQAHERQASVMTHAEPDPVTKASWNEIWPILDAELDALPDKARQLLIACYLQNKTHAQAAAELGLPPGSLARHLERARELLVRRLTRRGITVSSILLAVLLEDSAKGAVVPAVLLVHTVEAARTFTEQATGIVSNTVAHLVKGGLVQMTKTHFGIWLAGWVSLLGAGLIACQTLKAWPDQPSESGPPAAQAERPAQKIEKPVRTDCFGDPLPPGALARMGTVRLSNGGHSINSSTLLAFSPDGKRLASLIGAMTVVLWDAATGKEMRRFTSDKVIVSLGFSPDGKTLVTYSSQRVCLWEIATGKLLRTSKVSYQGPKREYIQAGPGRVAVLPDGRMLAVAQYAFVKDGKAIGLGIYVWDMATGEEVRQLKLSDPKKIGRLSATAFSPDGKLLATVGMPRDANGVIHYGEGCSDISVWDMATSKEICLLSLDKEDTAIKLAFSRDGKMLASADARTTFGNVRTVSVWDTATGKLIRRLQAPSDLQVDAPLAFSPDGKTLVGGQEGHLWEVSSGKEIRSLGLKIAKVALFSPDGKTLAVGDKGGVIRLWDMATGKEIFPHPGHRQCIQRVVYSPDGKMLASTGEDELVCLWEVATGKELRQLPRHTSGGPMVKSIAYSPDGKMLASPDGDVLHLWEVATGKEIHQLDVPTTKTKFKDSFRSVSFLPDGKKLATGTSLGRVVLWEAATGKEIYKLETGTATIATIAFSPDGRMLAIPGKDNTVSFWEVATGKLVSQLGGLKPGQQGKAQSVQYLAFSPDGRVLATSSLEDDKVRLWEVASGKEIGQLDGYKHRGDGKRSPGQLQGCMLTFSPDGRMLATAVPGRYFDAADLAVTLWDVATGKEIGRLAGHRNVIWTLAFSPDGKTLTSGSYDLTCLVWDVSSFAQQLKPARPLTPQTLSQEQLEAAWTELGSDDAAKAYRAVSVLQAVPKQAVPLLQARVRPVVALVDPKQLTRLIADLDDSNFKVRDKAQREIVRMGELAVPALRRALADRPPLEVKRRLQDLLATLEPKLVTTSAHRLREVRGVQVLESMATAESRQLLQDLAKGLAGVSLTREAQAALERLDKRSASRP